MENWKPVIGFEGFYEVSDRGSVRSADRIEVVKTRWGGFTSRKKHGKILSPGKKPGGYLFVGMFNGSEKAKYAMIHCLVAEAFIGERPTKHHHVAHNDGNKENNNLNNLRYATCKENSKDKIKHGTLLMGESIKNSKLKESDVILIRNMYGSVSAKQISCIFGIHENHVYRIANGDRWGWLASR